MSQPIGSVQVVAAFVTGVLLTGSVVTAQFPGGGGGSQERPVVGAFDADKDGRLNTAERQAARRRSPSLAGGRGGGAAGAAAATGRRQAPV